MIYSNVNQILWASHKINCFEKWIWKIANSGDRSRLNRRFCGDFHNMGFCHFPPKTFLAIFEPIQHFFSFLRTFHVTNQWTRESENWWLFSPLDSIFNVTINEKFYEKFESNLITRKLWSKLHCDRYFHPSKTRHGHVENVHCWFFFWLHCETLFNSAFRSICINP